MAIYNGLMLEKDEWSEKLQQTEAIALSGLKKDPKQFF